MNLESIIIVCVCLVVIAAVGYFLWNKISKQNKTIDELNKRIESIELMFTHPPSQDELNSIFGQRQMYIHQQNQHPQQYQHQPQFVSGQSTSQQKRQQFFEQEMQQSRSKTNCEVNGLCELKPLIVEPADITEVVTEAIIENHNEQESVPRRRENVKTV